MLAEKRERPMAAQDFRFSLTDEEKRWLHELVKLSILQGFRARGGKPAPPPAPPTTKLTEHLGAFVTLKIGKNLRGCIGNVAGERPLHETVAEMARHAAFKDTRFSPLSLEEFEELDIEISILGPLQRCPDPREIEVGRHGLVLRRGGYSGLLLPQVPLEWGWNREQFLEHTCRKAGMEPGCWQDPETEIFWFEAEVF